MKYPIIKTIHNDNDWMHNIIEVIFSENKSPLKFCGDSWCSGKCNMPALIIPESDNMLEHKMYSNMTAFGQLMQPWRVKWIGEKIEIPEQYREELMKRYWM